MTEQRELEKQSQDFAGRLSATVRSVFEDCGEFTANIFPDGSKSVVKQQEKFGIPLRVNGVQILALKVEYHCCLDRHGRYLAVETSSIEVFAGEKPDREPLFRYEYVRDPVGAVPAAHIHIHAHRDAFTAAMVRSGKATRRGSRRANNTGVPSMSEIHFPVGGSRFRPSLEDVLEMLIDEFGVDSPSDFRENLRKGRIDWRQIQLKAAVRDDPASAVEALKALGYDIQLPPGDEGPSVNRERLQEL